MASSAEWLRGRGIGRERLAGHLTQFLEGYGFRVERTDSTEPAETRVAGDLQRPNPSVPASGRHFEFRLSPTSGGCAVDWIAPMSVEVADRGRFDRLVRELQQHLERIVATESHGTAKLSASPTGRRPWDAPGGPGEPSASAPTP